MSKIFVLLMFISLSTVYANFVENELPDVVEPVSYNLKISPDLSTFKFYGKVDIEVRVKFSTGVIKLHCKSLEISKSKLYDKIVPDALFSIRLNKTDNYCETTSLQILKPGSIYVLSMEFNGDLKENTNGLYRTSYETNGMKKWLLATNFYGNHAREVFPCFDEPRFRTPFKISIAKNSNQKVISNTALDQTHAHNNKILVWNSFEITPPLSTYQVAFVVTEYSFTPETSNSIKIWARPDMIESVKYASKQTDKILKQLENFISIPYKASKVDFVVSSEDASRTQTDTWGLFLFTETQLISDEKNPSELQRRIVTSSICRQLARHWFGGQVVPASRDNSWLTEAFAGYMELVATTLVEPSWKIDAIFSIDVLQQALRGELKSAQTLTSSTKTRSRISNKHQLINQLKGTSIIRMLEHMISKSSLKSVIHKYLADSQKKNNGLVTPDDLFNTLKYQSDVDSFPLPAHFSIIDVMKTWTENQGYPLLIPTRNYQNGTIEIEQRAFRSKGAFTSSADENWIIPISYTTKSEASFTKTVPSEWIYTNKTTLPFNVESTDWIIFNLQQTNYYRVNYDTQNWNLLIKQLEENKTKIHFLNRAQLIDDAFTLASENELDYRIPLQLAKYLQNENEIVPVLSAVFHLDMLYTKYEDTISHAVIKRFIQEILEKQIQSLGFKINPSDDHLIKAGKPSILLLACKVGLSSCIQVASQEYKSNVKDLSKVPADLKEVVFCTAMSEGEKLDQNIYENLMATYHKSDIVYEKISILKTLGCTKDENLLKKILSKLFSKEDQISKLDEDYIIDSILSSSDGITTTLIFIKERASQITKMKNDELQTLKKLLHKIEHKVHTKKHMQLLKKLHAEFDSRLDENYNIYKELLRRAYSLSSGLVEENNKNSAILKPIFYDILNIPSVYIPPPSNDSPTNSVTSSLAMLFLGLFWVYMYEFYHLF